jgi:Domain of unknown function (DUF3427)/HNH endonuclease
MFKQGVNYTKSDIYRTMNVPEESQKGAWDTGYRRYKNDIFVFANIGVAGRTGHNYDNHWEGSDLVWYGKTTSHINQPLIQQMVKGEGKVYIFTRFDDRQPFTFQGEASVKSTEDISPVKITWSLKKAEVINVKEAWQILVRNAKIRHSSQETFVSPIQHHRYKIIEANTDFVRVMRMSIDSKTAADISYHIFEAAMYRVNKSEGILPRKELYNNVMVEAAMVQLLPMLDWDNDFQKVMVSSQGDPSWLTTSQSRSFTEANNDTEFKLITRMLRMRRGQNKLRENLFYLYQNKCCITQYGVKEVLHACHITPHSKSGANTTTNALLLRADIHDLFDSNLVAINPQTLQVETNKVLRNTEYYKINGTKISDRVDGIIPDSIALKDRWDIFHSLR